MPARSKDQREAMAIAEHEPGKLYSRNRGILGMSHSQLHDYAATKEHGLPKNLGMNLGRKSKIPGLGRKGY